MLRGEKEKFYLALLGDWIEIYKGFKEFSTCMYDIVKHHSVLPVKLL